MATSGRKVVANPVAANPLEWDPGPPQYFDLRGQLRGVIFTNGGAFEPLPFRTILSFENLMFRTIFNDIVATSWRPFSVFVPAAHEIAMLSIELLRTLKLLILSGPHRNVWPQPQPQHREQWWRPLLKPRSLETCSLFRLTVKSHAHSPLTRLLQSARCACSRRKGASSRRF